MCPPEQRCVRRTHVRRSGSVRLVVTVTPLPGSASRRRTSAAFNSCCSAPRGSGICIHRPTANASASSTSERARPEAEIRRHPDNLNHSIRRLPTDQNSRIGRERLRNQREYSGTYPPRRYSGCVAGQCGNDPQVRRESRHGATAYIGRCRHARKRVSPSLNGRMQ